MTGLNIFGPSAGGTYASDGLMTPAASLIALGAESTGDPAYMEKYCSAHSGHEKVLCSNIEAMTELRGEHASMWNCLRSKLSTRVFSWTAGIAVTILLAVFGGLFLVQIQTLSVIHSVDKRVAVIESTMTAPGR